MHGYSIESLQPSMNTLSISITVKAFEDLFFFYQSWAQWMFETHSMIFLKILINCWSVVGKQIWAFAAQRCTRGCAEFVPHNKNNVRGISWKLYYIESHFEMLLGLVFRKERFMYSRSGCFYNKKIFLLSFPIGLQRFVLFSFWGDKWNDNVWGICAFVATKDYPVISMVICITSNSVYNAAFMFTCVQSSIYWPQIVKHSDHFCKQTACITGFVQIYVNIGQKIE